MAAGAGSNRARLGRSLILKYVAVGAILSCTALFLLYHKQTVIAKVTNLTPWHNTTQSSGHPIERLILQAQAEQDWLLSRQSHGLVEAAERYRERRGRHPPPGFDKWFEYAHDHDAIVIEEFFDRIYHDLNPFWTIEPREIRRRAAPVTHEHIVSVRDHKAILKSPGDPMGRMPPWHNLVKELAKWLPDVDLPMNVMDESRLLVPWEEVNERVRKEAASRSLTPLQEVRGDYASLPPPDVEPEDGLYDAQWTGQGPYWELLRHTCPPRSSAHDMKAIDIYKDAIDMPTGYPRHSFSGYVQNWTLSKDPCEHPHLRSLEGTFIEPVSISTSHSFVPLFSGSKLPQNNEILIPPAMYLTSRELYSGGKGHGPEWSAKREGVVWRGVASGGRNKAETWTHYHRHRFVQMLNGTAVRESEAGRLPVNATAFKLPKLGQYGMSTFHKGDLSSWLSNTTDVAFTRLECFPYPADAPDDRFCSYTDPYFEISDLVPMQTQYDLKYLPDVDGNSYSGRFRAFLHNSGSLVLKATMYLEWHDDRLMPWVHFVPFDNTFIDIYGILHFFMGGGGSEGHDDMAARIAKEGNEWADKVLRREDMALYVWRLILEYARVCDDQREALGWVGDLNEP